MSSSYIKCEYCGKFSLKQNGHINRANKIKAPVFCSRSCSEKSRSVKSLNKKCSFDGCSNTYFGKGYCNTHYYRIRRTGDVNKCVLPEYTRFENGYIPEPNSGCWIWVSGISQVSGYGVFAGAGEKSAHRYSYKKHKGEIPNGLFVLHSCDNRVCVNPDHLFIGTAQDNVDDMFSKGRNNCWGHKTNTNFKQNRKKDQ